jgi:glycosyltransferase involved in cell wall biosynthesis
MTSLPAQITTIIPTFKRPERLKKAIQSVLNQTYPHFQVCIYDNHSEDETEEIVAELAAKDPRIEYHCHATNIGAGQNFQYGLDRVNTPFFSFLSDDDFLLPEFYETALKGFQRYPQAGFSATAVIDMSDEGEVIDVIFFRWPNQEYFCPPDGLLGMIGKYSNWIGALFRKEIVAQIGPLDLNVKAIDVDYLFRTAARYPFVITKKPCAVFVQHASSYSGHQGLKLIWPGWNIMIAKFNQDPHLSDKIKKQIEHKLLIDLQALLRMNLWRSLEKKQFDQASTILQYLNQKPSRRLLSFALKASRHLSPVQKGITLLLKIRRFWLRRIRTSRSCHSLHFNK